MRKAHSAQSTVSSKTYVNLGARNFLYISNCSNLVYTNNPFSNNEFNELNELLRVVIRLIRLIRCFYKIIVFIYLIKNIYIFFSFFCAWLLEKTVLCALCAFVPSY